MYYCKCGGCVYWFEQDGDLWIIQDIEFINNTISQEEIIGIGVCEICKSNNCVFACWCYDSIYCEIGELYEQYR